MNEEGLYVSDIKYIPKWARQMLEEEELNERRRTEKNQD